jgi:hypothetical protein
MGNFGILARKAALTLAEFLRRDFIPYVESKHSEKPGTLEYYSDGANMVLKCDWAGERLDQINDPEGPTICRQICSPSRHRASTVACGLCDVL